MKTGKNMARVVIDEKDFAAVLGIITTHRARALMSVNVESLLTYWEIGAFLSPRIHSGSWSTAVVGRLADYIKRKQPELKDTGRAIFTRWRHSTTRIQARSSWNAPGKTPR